MSRSNPPLFAFVLTVSLFLVPTYARLSAQSGVPAPPAAPAPAAPASPAAPTSAAGPTVPIVDRSQSDAQDTGTVTTLHAHSNLVVIDVVVTDSKQNPVHNLTRSDFVLTENNVPQQIKNFEEHTSTPEKDSSFGPAEKLPPGLFSNRAPATPSGPINVILLDTLNTPLTAQPFVHQQLIDYINKAAPGTRIAIFGLSTTLSMLQGFTTNPELLKNALNGKGNARPSDIMVDPLQGATNTDTTLSDNFSSTDLTAAQQLANINRFQALQTAFELQLRATYTLQAFDQLARYLEGMPGRKNVIWFSGSFPLSMEPSQDLQDPFDAVVRNDEEIRKTDNLLTRAQIAVYPVDARGLFNDPNYGTNRTAESQMNFLQQTSQEHETMFAMAEDTGGHAFVNTNGLSQAVAKAIDIGSHYYTLTYSPTNTRWDGRFRSIKVKVTQPGVNLTYRRGYYGDDPQDRSKLVAANAATAPGRPTTMTSAMVHGGPDPTEILLKVRVRPAATPPEDTPIKSNQINPDPKANVHGPYQQYGVDLTPDPRSFNCPSNANGVRQCTVEIATYVYDKDGVLINTASNGVRVNLSPESYAKMLVRGMAMHQQISVPIHGEYYLRTAIHDLTSDRVGAVEIPIAAVAKLHPLAAAVEPPAGIPVPTTPTTPSLPTAAQSATPAPNSAPQVAPH